MCGLILPRAKVPWLFLGVQYKTNKKCLHAYMFFHLCILALFKNDPNMEIKNALVFLLVLRVIENFFRKHVWFLDFSICPTWNPLLWPIPF